MIVISINGGHTKSTTLVTEKPGLVKVFDSESLNPHSLSQEVLRLRVNRIFAQAADILAIRGESLHEHVNKLVFSIPGASNSKERAQIESAAVWAGWRSLEKVQILDDTWAGLYAGGETLSGICGTSGSGASVYIGLPDDRKFVDGKERKLDGFGPVIGDFGSGFQLTVDALRRAVRNYESNGDTELQQLLVERAEDENLSEFAKIQGWIDSLFQQSKDSGDWKLTIARLASVVTSAADREKPNPDALALVKNAASEFWSTIKIALQKYSKLPNDYPLVLQGGMFEHCKLYRREVISAAKDAGLNAFLAERRPVIGAWLYSERDDLDKSWFWSQIDALPDDERKLVVDERGITL